MNIIHIASVALIATASTSIKMYIKYLKSKEWTNPITSNTVKIPKNLTFYKPESKKFIAGFASKDESTVILLQGIEFPNSVKLKELIEYKLDKMKKEFEGFDKYSCSFETIASKTVFVLRNKEKKYPYDTIYTIFTWVEGDRIEFNLTSAETIDNKHMSSNDFKESLIKSFST